MKRKIIVCSILLMFIWCGQTYSREIQVSETLYNEIVNETVLPYCMALKAGDVSSIKQYLSVEMYEKKRVLIEQNKGYPEFLRKYYQEAQFNIVKAEEIENNITVTVEFTYPDGRVTVGTLRIGLDNQAVHASDSWKIIDFGM